MVGPGGLRKFFSVNTLLRPTFHAHSIVLKGLFSGLSHQNIPSTARTPKTQARLVAARYPGATAVANPTPRRRRRLDMDAS
jgi:hypothetical protein